MKSQLVKGMAFAMSNLNVLGSARQSKLKNKEVTILCLHRVSDEPSVSWPPLPVGVFERLCQYWSKHYNVTDFRTLKDYTDSKKPSLILSFDDGYGDFYRNAWPVLQQYGLKVNMNIVTSCATDGRPIWTQRLNNAFDVLWEKGITEPIVLKNDSIIQPGISRQELYSESLKLFRFLCGFNASERQSILDDMITRMHIKEKATPFMTWEQIIELHKSGVEIGSHTSTHEILTNVSDESQLLEELRTSKIILEQKLGNPVQVLAFPNGYTNENVNLTAVDCGYEFLLGIEDALTSFAEMERAKALPRILVHHTGYYENLMTTENLFSRLKAFIK